MLSLCHLDWGVYVCLCRPEREYPTPGENIVGQSLIPLFVLKSIALHVESGTTQGEQEH